MGEKVQIKKDWLDYLNLMFSFITIVGLGLTLFFGYKGLVTNTTQLKELNAKAEIKLKLNFSTTTVSFGPQVSEPLQLNVNAINYGEYNTPTWSAAILFCKNIQVIDRDESWKSLDLKMFIYQSEKKVLTEQSFFGGDLNRVGTFRVRLSSSHVNPENIIPIAILMTYGEKAIPVQKVAILDRNSSNIEYQDFSSWEEIKRSGCY